MKYVNKRFSMSALLIASAICSLFVISENVSAAPRAAIRGSGVARQSAQKATTQTVTEETDSGLLEPEEEISETVDVEIDTPEPTANKSKKFDAVATSASTTSSKSASGNNMAEMIRKERAAFAAKDAMNAAAEQAQKALSGLNLCDLGLRDCMKKTCGDGFIKCALDGDTDFGAKINKCKRDLPCSGKEVNLFSTEIKADRDLSVQIASYNAVIDCANLYNTCIISECGTTFDKCLGKSAENAALNKCKDIATKCKEYDSGLPARAGKVIAGLRQNAEINIKKDEQRLYDLRELMQNACKKLGASFDERSFDCVYTVEFFAGEDNPDIPKASRKLYAGDMFTCTQEYFGIDVTTYRENALRETRAQKAASSAMLGAGAGVAAGAIASGAIGRAIETDKAKKEVNEAEKEKSKVECENANNYWVNNKECVKPDSECSTGVAGSSKGTGTWKKDASGPFCNVTKCNTELGWEPAKDGKSCAFLKKNQAKTNK